MPILDAYTNVIHNPGQRTTGNRAQSYLLTGPGYKGTVPVGMTQYRFPTNLIWIVGRIYSAGTPKDRDDIRVFQSRLSLVPLSARGTAYKAPLGNVDPKVDMRTSVRDQVDKMDTATYFKTLNALLKQHPPTDRDAPLMAKLDQLGIGPGREFDLAKLDPKIATRLKDIPAAAHKTIHGKEATSGRGVNGWTIPAKAGDYGTDYLHRAFMARTRLGANLPEDAVYLFSYNDIDGKELDGAHKYVIHFAKGERLPIRGFWSITMYNAEAFLVPNPANRYSVRQNDNMKTNADGSLDIHIQKDSPGKDKEANWLPAPDGKFSLLMRLYWPETPALEGTWEPPAVTRLK
jgi:hypothetical protein